MKAGQYFIILFVLMGSSTFAIGQNVTLSITMLSNPSITVNSANAYINGVTVSNTTFRTFAKRNVSWTLTVRASSTNLINGASGIPANQITMQATNTNLANKPLVTLSATDQTLVSEVSAVQDRTTDVNIDYKLAGGANLLKPSGNYSTILTFTMTQL